MGPEQRPLGAWADDLPAIRDAGVPGFGDVADLSEDIRFRVYVARLIRQRELNALSERDQPAAFVLVSAAGYQDRLVGRTEERLIHTGARRITGRIHFVQDKPISSVVEEVNGGDAAMFARLHSLGASKLPTLVYVPQTPTSSLSYYPHGTASDDGVSVVPLDMNEVQVVDIDDALNAIYAQELVNPDGSHPFKLWKDASSGTPIKEAEKGIQQFIRIGLSPRFSFCSIRWEQSSKSGRTDIEIVNDRFAGPGVSIHCALLELKALRSRGSTGLPTSEQETADHIKEGVAQACVYGDEKKTKAKLLCCFDMRDSDVGDPKTFEHVKVDARAKSILLRRWFMYRSSAQYRAAVMVQAS